MFMSFNNQGYLVNSTQKLQAFKRNTQHVAMVNKRQKSSIQSSGSQPGVCVPQGVREKSKGCARFKSYADLSNIYFLSATLIKNSLFLSTSTSYTYFAISTILPCRNIGKRRRSAAVLVTPMNQKCLVQEGAGKVLGEIGCHYHIIGL